MTDQPAPDRRRHAIAFNALGSALNASGHWLPFTARQTAVDAVLAALDADARDAARQTTGQTAVWPLATPCDYCSHTLNWHVTGGRCRVTAGEASCGCTAFVAPDGSHPDSAVIEAERVCALPNWADCSCNHLTGCEHPHPAVGQPAEAQATDRAAVLREAARAVFGRVEAHEGMDDIAFRLNRERSAIADLLRQMAEEARS